MRLRFFKTGDEAWKEVQEKILKSIEEEERRNTNLKIPSAVPPDYETEKYDILKGTATKLPILITAND